MWAGAPAQDTVRSPSFGTNTPHHDVTVTEDRLVTAVPGRSVVRFHGEAALRAVAGPTLVESLTAVAWIR